MKIQCNDGSWIMAEGDGDIELYLCDPAKHTDCEKTCCHTTCFHTLDPAYGMFPKEKEEKEE